MEEAYLRMEESNRRIQAQYSTLLRQYDDLSRRLPGAAAANEATGPPRGRTVGRETSDAGSRNILQRTEVVVDPSNLREVAAEAANLVPETTEAQQASGAEGRIRRSLPGASQPLAPPPNTPGAFGGNPPSAGSGTQPAEGAEGLLGRQSDGSRTGSQPASNMSRMDRIGAGAEGTDGRVSPEQQPTGAEGRIRREFQEIVGADQRPTAHRARVDFAEGLEFTSDDDEFKVQIHNLTQAEFRGFPTSNQGVLQSQFYIPRERWYFTGDLTRNVGFYTVINRGYGLLDILDAFISLRVDERLRLRVGRMKTPYLYEYFQIAEGDSISPERSIYAANLSLNRQIGAMLLGDLFEDRVSYAIGVYNGPRNSFGDIDSSKDVIGYIGFRPFLKSERFKALNYFNIGGSFDAGYENNIPPQPTYFETANDQTSGNGATGVSPTFLHLNNNVTEDGSRVQWAAHLVWFYKSFTLLTEYGGARAGYGFVNGRTSTPINIDGYTVEASYFLTGEQLTRRVNVVKPRRDFNFNFLKGGPFSPGAVEVHARFCAMDFGRNIFTGGFADPDLWTNHVWATDVGLNWYPTFYTRVFLDWQHAGFGNLVSVAPGKFSPTTDLFWLRFQVFF